jgi:hypothetical protein
MFQESFDWFRQHQGRLVQEATASPHRNTVKQRVLALLKKLS